MRVEDIRKGKCISRHPNKTTLATTKSWLLWYSYRWYS